MLVRFVCMYCILTFGIFVVFLAHFPYYFRCRTCSVTKRARWLKTWWNSASSAWEGFLMGGGWRTSGGQWQRGWGRRFRRRIWWVYFRGGGARGWGGRMDLEDVWVPCVVAWREICKVLRTSDYSILYSATCLMLSSSFFASAKMKQHSLYKRRPKAFFPLLRLCSWPHISFVYTLAAKFENDHIKGGGGSKIIPQLVPFFTCHESCVYMSYDDDDVVLCYENYYSRDKCACLPTCERSEALLGGLAKYTSQQRIYGRSRGPALSCLYSPESYRVEIWQESRVNGVWLVKHCKLFI